MVEIESVRGERQAGPFSRNNPKPDPKRPGRKGGSEYDAVTRRAVPDRIDQTVEVPEGHQVFTVGEPRAPGSDF